MNVLDMLKGKRVRVITDAKVAVELIIESIKQVQNSQELAPATRENDWWPPSREWTTFEVTFTNGYKKSYSKITDIELSKP